MNNAMLLFNFYYFHQLGFATADIIQGAFQTANVDGDYPVVLQGINQQAYEDNSENPINYYYF